SIRVSMSNRRKRNDSDPIPDGPCVSPIRLAAHDDSLDLVGPVLELRGQTPDHVVADLLDQRRDLPELDGMCLRAIVDPYEAIDAKLDSPSVGDETEKGLRGVAEPLLALAPFDHLQNARGVEPRAQAP